MSESIKKLIEQEIDILAFHLFSTLNEEEIKNVEGS